MTSPVAVSEPQKYKCLQCAREVILDNTEVVFDDTRCICLFCVDVLPRRAERRRADREQLDKQLLAAQSAGKPESKTGMEEILQIAAQAAEEAKREKGSS